MGVIDLVTRLDAICNKYDKFDVDKHHNNKGTNLNADDAFSRLYGAVEADLDAAIQKKSETVATEKNRARAVAVNAEIRRTKTRLMEELPKLQRLAFKRVKGVPKEELEARNELVAILKEKIEAIPDGSNTRTVGGGGANAVEGGHSGAGGIKFDFNYEEKARLNDEYFRTTEETEQFRNEYEMRRIKQDQGLDVIAEGLDNLKNMARDINEEFDRQLTLMDEIDDKVDRAASDLKSTNVRLKDTVNQLRSSRNFCIDIILLIIILGIAAYLYNVLK